jgi:beta-lactamase regulating signal transducer with metallopeptidase domain
LILVAAWFLCRAMPLATAAPRHLVSHGAMVGTLLLPLATLAQIPQISLAPIVPGVVPRVLDTLSSAPTPAPAIGTNPAVEIRSGHGVGSTRGSSVSDVLVSRLPTLGIQGVSAIGTGAVALWFAAGWLAAARLSRRAKPAPLAWQLELNALCERLRITRGVRLRLNEQHSSPLATGLLRSTILLPRTAAAWSADRRRAVLLHELAHIKRNDCRVQLLAQFACAMYWFNPLVWMAAAQLRSEREHACDDEVLRFGAQASSYAAHLLDIARELRPTSRPSAALAMARPSELEGRLLSVLAVGRARVPAPGTKWVVIGVLSLSTVAALGATSSPAPASTPASPLLEADAQYVVANDVMMSSEPLPRPRTEAEATLQASPDPQARERATLALAFTSGRDVIPALLKALDDSDAQVREKAAVGLALRRDARVVAPLIAAMNDHDSQVREKVAIALGSSGDRRARDVLLRALEDPDQQVREKASAALILLGLTGGR